MTSAKTESLLCTTQHDIDSYLANRLLSQSGSQNHAARTIDIASATLQKVLAGKETFKNNVRQKVGYVLSRYKVDQLTEHLHHPCIKMAHRQYWVLKNSTDASITDYEEIIRVAEFIKTHPESSMLDKMYSDFLASISYFAIYEAHKKAEKNAENEVPQKEASDKAKEAVETASNLSQAAYEIANQVSYKAPDIVRTILTWNFHVTKLSSQMEGKVNATDLEKAISELTPLAPFLGATAYTDMIELLLLEESLKNKQSASSKPDTKDYPLFIGSYLKSIRSLLNESDRYLTNYIAGCEEIKGILKDPRFADWFVTSNKEAKS